MPDICTVTSLYHYQTSCALLASRERPRDSHRDSHRDKHRRVGSSDRRRSAEPQAEATELNQREQDDIDKRAQRALAWQKKQADKQAAQVRFLHTDACSLTHSLARSLARLLTHSLACSLTHSLGAYAFYDSTDALRAFALRATGCPQGQYAAATFVCHCCKMPELL